MSPGVGPRAVSWALVIALLGLLGSAVIKLTSGESALRYAPPVVSDPDQAIEALGAEVELEAGVQSTYRLTTLYADPARQAFEAAALGARLGLESGEPWRLRRTIDGQAAASELARNVIEVRDDKGRALAPIPAAPAAGGPVDPVRPLFSTPAGVARGSSTEWVLWGRRPTGRVEVRLEPAGVPVVLEPRHVKRSEIEVALARIDRPEIEGKKAAAPASERDDGDAGDDQR